MVPSLQQFGNSWTEDKLECVRKYLVAYTTIMKNYRYDFAYIDGFAGTGYREQKSEKGNEGPSLFAGMDEMDEPEVQAFLDGSARNALRVEPRFHKYVFIEKNPRKATELEKLRTEFSDRADDISIEPGDANVCLQKRCKASWKNHRAVLFLDPFGMQLRWETVKAIGMTQAIDTWILFPLSAANRLMSNDAKIPTGWRRSLDSMFGETDWFEAFFSKRERDLFQTEPDDREKSVNVEGIGKYFNERLSAAFPFVASNPRTFYNSKNTPLFLLCFAAANETAIKISEHILGKRAAKRHARS